MEIPSDDEFKASADELTKDRADLVAKFAASPQVASRTDAFLQHLESIGGELLTGAGVVLEEGSKIAIPLLEQLAVGAIQGALERRK